MGKGKCGGRGVDGLGGGSPCCKHEDCTIAWCDIPFASGTQGYPIPEGFATVNLPLLTCITVMDLGLEPKHVCFCKAQPERHLFRLVFFSREFAEAQAMPFTQDTSSRSTYRPCCAMLSHALPCSADNLVYR